MYDPLFFAANRESAARSAGKVMPWLLDRLQPASVVDVGCGAGEWGVVAERAGIETLGVDGHSAGECALGWFAEVDLTGGYDCAGFDLAICLEVAEHLPERSAEPLVAGLCNARWVLFSAAWPGQGGVGHVNEQWATWWAARFRQHGYLGSTAIRWHFWDDRDVNDFYRENMVLYGRDVLGPPVVDVIHPERFGRWPS